VVAVERLEEQHLVAGIEQGHGGGVQTASGAGGDQDFGLRVVGEAVVALLLGGDGVAQASDAVEPGVDVVAVVDGGMAASASTGAGTGVSQMPWARLMPPMRSHSVVMARISDCIAPGASSLRARRCGAWGKGRSPTPSYNGHRCRFPQPTTANESTVSLVQAFKDLV
jgi:hypothetical protein